MVSSQQTDESGIYATAQTASFIRDDLSGLDLAHKELIDEFVTYVDDARAVRVLTRYMIAAERKGENALKWQPVRDLIRKCANDSMVSAINEGNAPRLQSVVGLVDHSSKATGGDDVLTKFVTREGYGLYLIGGTGDGKNNCAFKMAERAKENRGDLILSNTYSLNKKDYFVDSITRLREIGRQHDGWKLAILDEVSNWGTGRNQSADEVGRLLKFARKDRYKINIVFIGHDGKDLHPSARDTVDHVARMAPRNYGQGDDRDAKIEKIGRRIEDRKIRDEIAESPISGIKESFMDYDDGESSTFYLEEDREERIRARLEHPDVEYPHKKIAAAEDISRQRVGQIIDSLESENNDSHDKATT